MHRNYFTLYYAARELDDKLAGGRIDALCTGRKGFAKIGFVLPGGSGMQLLVAPGSSRFGMIVNEGMPHADRNSATLIREVTGKSVSGVTMSPFDRELAVILEHDERLILQFSGPKSNILFVRGCIIVDAFRGSEVLAGTELQERSAGEGIIRCLEKLALDKQLFLERYDAEKTALLHEKLSAVLPGFDLSLSRELLRRTGNDPSAETIYGMFRTLFFDMLDPVASVSEKDTGEPLFSILSRSGENVRTFDSVLEGLSMYSRSMLRFLQTKEALKRFRAELLQRLRKKEKELLSYNPGILETLSRTSETCGHLLMASLSNEGKGRKSITVGNVFESGAPPMTIDLKEALTLRENAQAYFAKAAKTRSALAVMKERHEMLEFDKALLLKTMGALDGIKHPDDARRFLLEHGAEANDTGKKTTPAPFRTVRISPRATLYIGKNAENNDRLTFGFAKPDDIWLHARGSSGSHCVLKGSGPDHLEDIGKAAGIAAWHSAAKHSELVPVIYTLKKYVRRSKKLAKGQVIVEREKVLFVRPSRDSG